MQVELVDDSALEPTGLIRQQRTPPLWLFAIMAFPNGMFFAGVVGGLFSYLLRRDGTAVSAIANEAAILAIPTTIYFLWGPLSDFWLRRRTWFGVAMLTAAIAIFAAYHLHSLAEPLAKVLLFVAGCAVTLGTAARGGLIAELIPEEKRTHAGSWIQAGGLTGAAVGSGGLVALSEHLNRGSIGFVVTILFAAFALPILLVDEPPVKPLGGIHLLGRRLAVIGVEFRDTYFNWNAGLTLALLIAPLSSGAAIGLLPGIAVDYGISANQIAWLNGLGGAVLMATGALLAIFVPASFDIRMSYILAGLANAAACGILCFGPTVPATYLVGTVLYLLTVGSGLAFYEGLILTLVGKAGASGSTRYAITASLGSLCLVYMSAADGLGAKWFGPRGLPGMDMAVSGAVGIAFLIYLKASGRRAES